MFDEEIEEIEKVEEEQCAFCDELIDECPCAPPPKCPFCGSEAEMGGEISLEHLDCKHFVGGWDDGGFQKFLLEEFTIPVLPEKLKDAQWSAENLKTLFEEAEPLLTAYKGDFADTPDKEEFSEILLKIMPEIERQSYYDQHPASMLSWEAVMFFTKNPDLARERITGLIGKLQKGFESLEDSTGSR